MSTFDFNGFFTTFDPIRAAGWHNSVKAMSTDYSAVGATWEHLRGIAENNRPHADDNGVEYKCFDRNSHSDKTLFGQVPKWLGDMSTRRLVRDYGWLDEQGRIQCYSKLNNKPNGRGLWLYVANRTIFLMHETTRLGYWGVPLLRPRINQKLRNTVFIAAERRLLQGRVQFRYVEPTFCIAPSVDRFITAVGSGHLVLDARLHMAPPNGKVRNHSSAFRIKFRDLPKLYDTVLAEYEVRSRKLAA